MCRFVFLMIVAIVCFSAAISCSTSDDDDADDDVIDDDVVDDDVVDDDVVDDDVVDDDVVDDDVVDDDAVDDDAVDDDAADDDTAGNTFPPESQTPLWEKGLILPIDSLECYPVGGPPQTNCNHHGSTVTELPDGTMAAAWFHGEHEKSLDARIVWSQIEPGKTEWTWPEVLYDDPERSEGNPVLWVREDGELYVFFVSIYGNGWNHSKVRLLTSSDGGASWSDPVTLRNRYCWMTRHRPARLTNGELLLPLYNECLAYPVFMRSTDDFANWTEEAHLNLSYYLDHPGQIQPALAVLEDGTVTAVTRDGLPTNRVKRMVSEDNGVTWSRSRMTSLPNSGTSVDQVALLDGHVVVVFNDDPHARFPLSAALSFDGGETYLTQCDLNDECDNPPCSYPYPSIAQNTHDGTIWVTYTHNRKTIGWVHFNEAWLLEEAAR